MCSDSWFDYFDRAELHNLTCSSSDHSPMWLVTRKHPFHLKHIRFKFNNSWVRELELYQVMTIMGWFRGMGLLDKFCICAGRVSQWGRSL